MSGYDENLLKNAPEPSREAKQEGYNIDLLNQERVASATPPIRSRSAATPPTGASASFPATSVSPGPDALAGDRDSGGDYEAVGAGGVGAAGGKEYSSLSQAEEAPGRSDHAAPSFWRSAKGKVVIGVLLLVIIAAVVGGTVGGTVGNNKKSNNNSASSPPSPAGGPSSTNGGAQPDSSTGAPPSTTRTQPAGSNTSSTSSSDSVAVPSSDSSNTASAQPVPSNTSSSPGGIATGRPDPTQTPGTNIAHGARRNGAIAYEPDV